MTKTINGLTVTTSAASGDFLPIWRASNGDTRKITKANFMGGVLTGAGTLATGGFTLTVPATGTAMLLSSDQTVAGVKRFSDEIRVGATSQYLSTRRASTTLSNSGFTSIFTGLTGISIVLFQVNSNATNFGGALLCINNAGTLSISTITVTGVVSGAPTGFNIGYQASTTALQLQAGPSWPSTVGCNACVLQLIW